MLFGVNMLTCPLNLIEGDITLLRPGNAEFQRSLADNFFPGVAKQLFKGFIDIGKDSLGQFSKRSGYSELVEEKGIFQLALLQRLLGPFALGDVTGNLGEANHLSILIP